jgi:hypothetical protein
LFIKKELIQLFLTYLIFLSAGLAEPTLQSFPSFGRVYAAYSGVFVILAVIWGWLVDKKTPDMYPSLFHQTLNDQSSLIFLLSLTSCCSTTKESKQLMINKRNKYEHILDDNSKSSQFI